MITQRKGSWIETFTGKAFWPLDARASEVYIRDIAHALSLICRYNGHCKFFYSVAQHSILAAKELKKLGHGPLIQLYGLFHDASEAYICDVPRPIKGFIENYKAIEKKLQDIIWESLGVPVPSQTSYEIVKLVDDTMLTYEARTLMVSKGEGWTSYPSYDTNIEIEEMLVSNVEKEFLELADKLLNALKNE